MERFQTVITVQMDGGQQIVVRVADVHLSPLAVAVDVQPRVGGMFPVAHGVRHESWEE